MFCTKCGANLADAARYCSSCGNPAFDQPPGLNSGEPSVVNPAPVRRLRRVLAGKKIAGVCTGFAEYFDMDIVLMRLIWIGIALVPPNVGIFGYVISWIVLPKS